MKVIAEFTVCSREDSEELNLQATTYTARMFDNFKIEIEGILYSNEDFNNEYSINIP